VALAPQWSQGPHEKLHRGRLLHTPRPKAAERGTGDGRPCKDIFVGEKEKGKKIKSKQNKKQKQELSLCNRNHACTLYWYL